MNRFNLNTLAAAQTNDGQIKLKLPITAEGYHPNKWYYAQLTKEQIEYIRIKLEVFEQTDHLVSLVALSMVPPVDAQVGKISPYFVDVQPIENGEAKAVLAALRSARNAGKNKSGDAGKAFFFKSL